MRKRGFILRLLIRDMNDPFEVGKKSYAVVDQPFSVRLRKNSYTVEKIIKNETPERPFPHPILLVIKKIPFFLKMSRYIFSFISYYPAVFVSPIYPLIAVRVVLSRITEKSRSTTKTGKKPVRVFLFIV